MTKGKRKIGGRRPSKEEQSARFVEAAKRAEADETGEQFEKAFKKLAGQTRTAKK